MSKAFLKSMNNACTPFCPFVLLLSVASNQLWVILIKAETVDRLAVRHVELYCIGCLLYVVSVAIFREPCPVVVGQIFVGSRWKCPHAD